MVDADLDWCSEWEGWRIIDGDEQKRLVQLEKPTMLGAHDLAADSLALLTFEEAE